VQESCPVCARRRDWPAAWHRIEWSTSAALHVFGP
jgi:hypothetical protein